MMKFGLIGEHLSHSFSPTIHSKIADYPYELTPLSPCELDGFMRGKSFSGINVTIPYKQTVIPYLDEIDAHAKQIGAVNTVVNRDGRLIGYNTDFYGMRQLIEHIGISLAGKKVLILGTGGTSRTAKAVAASLGANEIIVVGRNGGGDTVSYEDAYRLHTDAQYVINTTPCGMYPYPEGNEGTKACAIELTQFPNLTGVADVVFNPLRTVLVTKARELGIPADGGLYMLVAQAVAAAEKFLDTEMDRSIIDRIYRDLRASKENIVLVGMPGCGKSTVGEELSQKLERPFIDCDEEIVKKAGKPITDIFAEVGEAGFRKIEAEVISEIAQTAVGSVISTGGGAVLRDENVARLQRNGRLYFLDRPIENIKPTPSRPLSMDREALQKRYEERYPRYLAVADCHIRTDENIENTIQTIEEDFIK